MKWPALWPTGLLALLIAGLDSQWLTSGSAHPFAEGTQWTQRRRLVVRCVQISGLRSCDILSVAGTKFVPSGSMGLIVT